LNGLPDGLTLVTAKVVHNHDVAWLEDWGELLFGISQKARSIDRSIEDARGR
jgi:hypothetical protein